MSVAKRYIPRTRRIYDFSRRWLAGHWLNWRAQPQANLRRLYDGQRGLRMLVFHDTGPTQMRSFRRIVDWCREHYEMAGPEELDALSEGRFQPGQRDKLLLTFDDGIEQHYDAARWMAEQGLRGVFFVIPSLFEQTVTQFLERHAQQGVEAFAIGRLNEIQPVRGLSRTQVREMAAMGHRMAGHNYAHRNLGQLHRPEELDYEIGRSLDELEELLGKPCRDFAYGFGTIGHVSDEALRYLHERRVRVHSSVRGLNLPGRTPRVLLRDSIATSHPFAFIKLASLGGLDHRNIDLQRNLLVRAGTLPTTPQPGSP